MEDGGSQATILVSIKDFERRLAGIDSKEAELLDAKLSGDWSDEAIKRARAKLEPERTHYKDMIERLLAQLETLNQVAEVADAIEAFRDRIVTRLDSVTEEDRRWILETLCTRVTIEEGKGPDIQIGLPKVVKDPLQSIGLVHSSQV